MKRALTSVAAGIFLCLIPIFLYWVAGGDFPEALIALDDGNSDSAEDWTWVRCESVEVVR